MPTPHTIDIEKLGNVFRAPAAHAREHLAAIAVCGHNNGATDEDAARVGHGLKPCGHVDAVTIHVAVVFNNIAEIDAYAQLERAVVETLLDGERRVDGFIDAWKHRKKAVAGVLERPPTMPSHRGFDQIIEYRAQVGVGGSFVFSHQQAVADNVGGHDRSELAFHSMGLPSRGQSHIGIWTFTATQVFTLDRPTRMRLSTLLINA